MRGIIIFDHGESRRTGMERFSGTEYRESGTSTWSGYAVTLPTAWLSHIPSRHLIEELARRVNVAIVADDDPSPTDISETGATCDCAYPVGDSKLTPGPHHHPCCPAWRELYP